MPEEFPENHPVHVRNPPTGWAPTKGCPGCFYGPKRFDHSTACGLRLKAMREDKPAPAAEAATAPSAAAPAPAPGLAPPPGLELRSDSSAPADPHFSGSAAPSSRRGVARSARSQLVRPGRWAAACPRLASAPHRTGPGWAGRRRRAAPRPRRLRVGRQGIYCLVRRGGPSPYHGHEEGHCGGQVGMGICFIFSHHWKESILQVCGAHRLRRAPLSARAGG